MTTLNPISTVTQTATFTPLSHPPQLNQFLEDIFANYVKDYSAQPRLREYNWNCVGLDSIKRLENEFRQLGLTQQTSLSDCLDSLEILIYKISTTFRKKFPTLTPKMLIPSELDKVFLEISFQRLSRNEFLKAATAFSEISLDYIQHHEEALKGLVQHCNQMLSKDNLEQMASLFDVCIQKQRGLTLVSILIVQLLELDKANIEKIKKVVTLLSPTTIENVQGWVKEGISHNYDNNIRNNIVITMAGISLLLQHPQQEKWCNASIKELIETCIFSTYNVDIGIPLIDMYLLPHPETQAQGMIYIHTLIQRHITNEHQYEATNLIEKYLLNKPETYEEGIEYICTLISTEISKEYNSMASDLIDKYLMINPKMFQRGISYYCSIIKRLCEQDWDHHAKPYIAKVEANVKSIIFLPILEEGHRNALKASIQGLSNLHTSDKAITLLCLAKVNLKDQQFVKDLAQTFIQTMENTELDKVVMVKALFLS